VRTFTSGTPLFLDRKKCSHWIIPLTADVFYEQPLIARMAVGDKNSLGKGAKKICPNMISPYLKIFFQKLEKLCLLKKKKKKYSQLE